MCTNRHLLLLLLSALCGLWIVTGAEDDIQGHCDANSGQCPSEGKPSAKKSQSSDLNIVMVVIDDLGWNDLGFSGAEYSTPNIDRVAAESVRLSQYYVQATCSPSRAALLTGRYPFRDGLARHVITNGYPFGVPLSHITLANALQNAGYATHAVGKWDVGMDTWDHTPTHRGFDTFLGHCNAFIDHYTFDTYASGLPKGHALISGRDLHWNEAPATNITEGYSTLLFGGHAVNLVRSHDFSGKPLFLYLAHTSLHSPLEYPQEYASRCVDINPGPRQAFCRMAQVLDDTVGELVSALQEANVWEKTVFIFTTDNGGQASEGSSNYPLRGNKRTVFEGGVRGSAFVHFPDMAASQKGSESMALMHLVDWFPTLVEGVAGVPLSTISNLQEQDGVNCWPSIVNGTDSPRTEIVLNLDPPGEHYIGQAALRFVNWKLIVGLPNCSVKPLPPDAPGGMCPSGWLRPGEPMINPVEKKPPYIWLFDLEADPEETNDLSEELPGIVSMMQERLAKYPRVPQLNPSFDYASDPKNFNGYWMPWLG